MANVPVTLVGGTYQSRSLPLSSQVTRNWYPEINPDAKTVISMMPTPGAKPFSVGVSGELERGVHDFNGVLYKVSGTTLYEISSTGTQTSIGTISGSFRCSFINDATTMVIVSGGLVYSYNGTTLQEETDSDFESPQTVAYLNNQAIYDGTNNRFAVSDAGLLTIINSLNYGAAESAGDDLVRVYAFNQVLYLLGQKTIEPWYNTGEGEPPFARIEGGIITVGLGAMFSVSNNDNFMYFFSDDRSIYRVSGQSSFTKVINPAIGYTFQQYETVSDAIGNCFTFNGQNFYMLTFPSQNKTWVYSESSDSFFELSTGVDGSRHLSNSYVYIYGKHLISDYNSGDIYEWDFDTFTDNGETIKRVRQTRTLDGGLLSPQAVGKTIFMGELEVIMNTGNTDLLSGQGSNPEIMLRYSDDGGRTWSGYINGLVGEKSQHNIKVKFSPLGSFRQRIIELSATDPLAWEIYGARAEIELGI